MFHSGGDTSSDCQVSDYVDKYCAHVELLDLCVSSENSFKRDFFKFFVKLGEREKFSRPSCQTGIARSLPLLPLEPACHVELPTFQSKVQSSLRPASSGVAITDGDDVPPAWRCESCLQTTLIDGVVPRSARRGFDEAHFLVRRRQARPHAAVLRSRGL